MTEPKYENGENEKSDRPTDFAHFLAWLAMGIGRDLTVEETDLSNPEILQLAEGFRKIDPSKLNLDDE